VASLTIVAVVAALLLFVVFPSGASTGVAAATDKLAARADQGTVRVLITQPWGGGQLILVRFDHRGQRMLRLAFVSHAVRGWRTGGVTEKRAEITDVAIGSLLVARSPGGKGQPPWSVAAGELGDPRIQRIDVRWATGPTTTGGRQNDSYFVVQRGTGRPVSIRYATKNGTEIATVPVA